MENNLQNNAEVVDGVLIITRFIDAPCELVFKAWSEKDNLVNWWGLPKNATMPFCEVNFKIDGYFHFKVENPGWPVFWGKGIYTEIKAPERIVFDNYFSNEQGDLIMSVGKVSVVMQETKDGKTKMVVHHSGIHEGNGESPAQGTMAQYKQGWSESLDRLEHHLSH